MQQADLSLDAPHSRLVCCLLPGLLPHRPPLPGGEVLPGPGERGGGVGGGRADQLQAQPALLGQIELVH